MSMSGADISTSSASSSSWRTDRVTWAVICWRMSSELTPRQRDEADALARSLWFPCRAVEPVWGVSTWTASSSGTIRAPNIPASNMARGITACTAGEVVPLDTICRTTRLTIGTFTLNLASIPTRSSIAAAMPTPDTAGH